MASEYWKWKFRDVQPDEKVELTPEQKRKNWWYYHKWHIAIGVLLLAAGANILMHVLGVGDVRPDYQFAYVGEYALPDASVSALEEALSALGEDCNGDGRVSVQINQYASGGASSEVSPYYQMAANTKLMADLSARESYFFLLDDPEKFQQDYHALRRLDGSLPGDADADWQSCCLRWTDCPALAGLELGAYDESALNREISGESQALFSQLYVARRGFWTEEVCENVEACDALWAQIAREANS